MKHEQTIVNFIALTVILTIGIQAYWNYVQYVNNRIQVTNEIQILLDNVSKDYTKIHTQKSTLTHGIITSQIGDTKTDSIKKIVNSIIGEFKVKNQLNAKETDVPSISYSIIQDSVSLTEFDLMLKRELVDKNYDINYYLTLTKNEKVINSLGQKLETNETLKAKSQLTPLESTSAINLNYTNPILPSLLKGLTGIVLSFLLCGIVIFALYYLLYIIRKQKQLSEIKNDFISNVTHEFKTPIATVSSAIEAIKNFNNENISEKTMRYLDISSQQLKKLNVLVEKVIETSIMESSELHLEKINLDIIKLIKECFEKHQINTSKNICFVSNIEHFNFEVDEFHFENAISNLIDNAIKYGGNEIKVVVSKNEKALIITVSDNGIGISTEDATYIFDKFFRVKNQNIHTIKGFGIGLYYTKKIIEKHNGTIELRKRNTFEITLWIK